MEKEQAQTDHLLLRDPLAVINELREKIGRVRKDAKLLDHTTRNDDSKEKQLVRRQNELEARTHRSLTTLEIHTELTVNYNHENWGLNQTQSKDIVASLKMQDRTKAVEAFFHEGRLSDPILAANCELLLYQLAVFENDLTMIYADIAGEKRSSCFWGLQIGFYPIKQPKRVGDELELLITVPTVNQDDFYDNIHLGTSTQ